LTPLNHAERNLALRAALDLWDDAPDTKRLFLLNLNKAWNQQKLRQSRTDKKALNTYLKNETKMRLDFMAERSGVRLSDMLEKIINEHYRKTCGGE
ncbi:RepB family protein, partial [Enterobacter ludwigii]|uniref:RepB family protein n=1 Tax=Enterobacter ludwigii TaxID=299767 RepID=UPI003BEF0B4B